MSTAKCLGAAMVFTGIALILTYLYLAWYQTQPVIDIVYVYC